MSHNFKIILAAFTILLFIFSNCSCSNSQSSKTPTKELHIYLCFGQSNMDGAAPIEAIDTTDVDTRFRVFQATDCQDLGRVKGNWYTAVPPLTRCSSGLGPVDYFGRTMVENLPQNIRVGVVMVAVPGCKIELFDKDNFHSYVEEVKETDWMINLIKEYGGNPYEYLVNLAKAAQKEGVIKGILLHQGESNNGDIEWPAKVKSIYDNLLSDLGLAANSIPLLAGEMLHGGCCDDMNDIMATLPETIPCSYVISSEGCEGQDDAHFSSNGCRTFGKRYAEKMLSILSDKK